jgi:ABC-2 type transport system ATP-binding protein
MNTITCVSAAVGTGLGAALPPVSLHVRSGVVTAIPVESDERPLLLSLMLGGRLRPDSGQVLIDGVDAASQLREQVALVDTPLVAEPGAGISLAVTVAEECAFAGMPSSSRAVHTLLQEQRLGAYEKLPVRALPAAERVRLFSELAVQRPAVTCIIVTSPERHGAAPDTWLPSLTDIASRGIAVVVVTDALTASALYALGASDAAENPDPVETPDAIETPDPNSEPVKAETP